MKELIKNQKLIADELLHILSGADPHVILAGGCPRDWYFDKPANDLDFYVHLPQATTTFEEYRWKSLGLSLKTLTSSNNGERDEHMYSCMDHLYRVWEGVYKGQSYQVMVMTSPTFDCVVNKFGSSVCMCWYKNKDQGVQVTEEFLFSHANKINFIKDDYTAKVAHVAKMQERYPEYKTLQFNEYERFKKSFRQKHDCFNVYKKCKEILCKMK